MLRFDRTQAVVAQRYLHRAAKYCYQPREKLKDGSNGTSQKSKTNRRAALAWGSTSSSGLDGDRTVSAIAIQNPRYLGGENPGEPPLPSVHPFFSSDKIHVVT